MFSFEDLLQGNRGHISIVGTTDPAPDLSFRSAQHDSRHCGVGDLYIALKGARVDGHDFIPDAARAGAIGALCTTPHADVPPGFLQFVVPDVVKAVQATARVRVQRQPETIKIGITGSSGKTTTKEAIAAILSKVAPTLKTYSSYNNELGYPLTLLSLQAEHRYAVLEMGTERIGELRELCETIARPDWSVIITVGAAHLKYFGTRENVAIGKSELVQVLSEEGIALLNYDDQRVRAMNEKTRARVIYYGRDAQADVRAVELQGLGLFGTHFILCVERQKIPVKLALPGAHGVTTALAAAAVGHAAGIPLDVIRDGLETLTPFKGRGEVRRGAGPNGSTVIDDTYNSVQESLIIMTQALRETPLPATGKRWAVLGEVMEQGDYTLEGHYSVGKALNGTCDYLVAIGDYARYFIQGAQESGMPAQNIYYFQVDPYQEAEVEEAKRAAVALLKEKVKSDDLVLVKGGHRLHMETMVALLTDQKGEEE
ncbi:UDP-N-acetylmuramoyl-tripeptide--D-alanyl-D-alanine ligase [Ktedonosporobacter rubrisoli]|uniref:UDP-N-acetylmuramoyl-tripeptide--D-alanyl-D-alanine ligase n=1 Tax=Ktedonosporobacter rubrisoli TaxID=2509675 RepID=A0A4P6JNG8_KTERU|nr:UDP-N-acetylmuramoyl-tripeptide--D-alanyl-D-alanine ligase [Ktedonosporobacter rubrisoli]QBD76713.1 UDP-N-acetylmuramoyl-tripeptide--D-alanyl-D-alanine ligase [Ktedonosporobacter rubrisoli]